MGPSPDRGVVALAMLAPLVLHGAILAFGHHPAARGVLFDPDAYLRLVRVMELAEHGRWFDQSVPRANAPYGTIVPWSRVLDILLLLGAWIGTLATDFRTALFWVGVVSGPLLQAAATGLLAFAAAPLLAPAWRMVAVALFLAQSGLYSFFQLGRPDHHALQVVMVLAVVAVALRAQPRPTEVRGALLAGALAALALWVSVEGLLVVLVVGLGVGLPWLRDGGAGARWIARFASGFAIIATLSIPIEVPPDGWFAVDYDETSIVHVVLGLGMALGALAADRAASALTTLPRRCAGGAALAAALAAVMAIAFPGFFAGPFGNVTEEAQALLMASTSEARPLWPKQASDIAPLLFHLAPVAIAVPFAAWQGFGARKSDRHVVLLAGIIVYGAFALAHQRVAPFAQALAVIPWAGAMAALWPSNWRAASVARAIGGIGAAVLLAGAPALASVAMARIAPLPASHDDTCRWDALARFLDEARPAIERPIVLTTMYAGPELMWRTPYDVVTAPLYDDRDGMMDTLTVLAARDDVQARAIMDRRGVGLIVLCRDSPNVDAGAWAPLTAAPDTLYRRLLVAAPPPWLASVALPPDIAGSFVVYAWMAAD